MKRIHTLLLLALAGCAAADSGSNENPPGGTNGVSVPGARDIARFRSMVMAGQIPAPEVLDGLGFLAEHKLDLPPADCGQRICVHARLGAAGNLITGANSTMVILGINTPTATASAERPPIHLVLAFEQGV